LQYNSIVLVYCIIIANPNTIIIIAKHANKYCNSRLLVIGRKHQTQIVVHDTIHCLFLLFIIYGVSSLLLLGGVYFFVASSSSICANTSSVFFVAGVGACVVNDEERRWLQQPTTLLCRKSTTS